MSEVIEPCQWLHELVILPLKGRSAPIGISWNDVEKYRVAAKSRSPEDKPYVKECVRVEGEGIKQFLLNKFGIDRVDSAVMQRIVSRMLFLKTNLLEDYEEVFAERLISLYNKNLSSIGISGDNTERFWRGYFRLKQEQGKLVLADREPQVSVLNRLINPDTPLPTRPAGCSYQEAGKYYNSKRDELHNSEFNERVRNTDRKGFLELLQYHNFTDLRELGRHSEGSILMPILSVIKELAYNVRRDDIRRESGSQRRYIETIQGQYNQARNILQTLFNKLSIDLIPEVFLSEYFGFTERLEEKRAGRVPLLPAKPPKPVEYGREIREGFEARQPLPEVPIPPACQIVLGNLADTSIDLPEHPRGMTWKTALSVLSEDLQVIVNGERFESDFAREVVAVADVLNKLQITDRDIERADPSRKRVFEVTRELILVKSVIYRMRHSRDSMVRADEINTHGREAIRGLSEMFPELDVARFLNIYFGFSEVKSQEEGRGEGEKPKYWPLVYLGRVEADILQPQLERAPWDLALLAQSMEGLPLYRSREFLSAAPALDRLIGILMLDNEITDPIRQLLPISHKFGIPIQIPITARSESGAVREFTFALSRGRDGLFRLGIEYNYREQEKVASPLNTIIIFRPDGSVMIENRRDLGNIAASADSCIFSEITAVTSSSSTIKGCSSKTLEDISKWWNLAKSGQFTVKLLAAGTMRSEMEMEIPADLPDSTRRFLAIDPERFVLGYTNCTSQSDCVPNPIEDIQWVDGYRIDNSRIEYSRANNNELRLRLHAPAGRYNVIVRVDGTIVLDPAIYFKTVDNRKIMASKNAYDTFMEQVRTIASGEYPQREETRLTRDQAVRLVAWYESLTWASSEDRGGTPPGSGGGPPPNGGNGHEPEGTEQGEMTVVHPIINVLLCILNSNTEIVQRMGARITVESLVQGQEYTVPIVVHEGTYMRRMGIAISYKDNNIIIRFRSNFRWSLGNSGIELPQNNEIVISLNGSVTASDLALPSITNRLSRLIQINSGINTDSARNLDTTLRELKT